jgi:hypothetical protein
MRSRCVNIGTLLRPICPFRGWDATRGQFLLSCMEDKVAENPIRPPSV